MQRRHDKSHTSHHPAQQQTAAKGKAFVDDRGPLLTIIVIHTNRERERERERETTTTTTTSCILYIQKLRYGALTLSKQKQQTFSTVQTVVVVSVLLHLGIK